MSEDRLMEVVADLEDRLEDVRMDLESEKERNDRLEERLRATIDDLVDERNRADRLEAQLQSERERTDRLEEELASEREHRCDLEEELADVKETADFTKESLFDLEDSVLGEYSPALWGENESVVGDIDALEDRVTKVERGEVDASEVVAQSSGPAIEDLIPLHQNYLQATKLDACDHELDSNQEIAARSFPFLADQAMPRGDSKLVLKSPKMRDVIERKVGSPELAERLPQVENPSRETVKRVMKFIDGFGKDMFEMKWAKNTGRNTNEIVIDRDQWMDYRDTLTGQDGRETDVSGQEDADPAEDADDIIDSLATGERVATDGGGT